MKHKSFFIIIFVISGFLVTSLSCLGIEESINSIFDEISALISDINLEIDTANDNVHMTPPTIDDRYSDFFENAEANADLVVYTLYYLITNDPDNEKVPSPEEIKSSGQSIRGVLERNPLAPNYGDIVFDIGLITQLNVFPPGSAYYMTMETKFPDGTTFYSPVERMDSAN